MSNVHSIEGPASSATLREFAQQSSKRTPAKAEAVVGDQVEISELAGLLNRLAELPEDRARKIIDIRNAIQRDVYETDDKLDAATEGVLRDL